MNRHRDLYLLKESGASRQEIYLAARAKVGSVEDAINLCRVICGISKQEATQIANIAEALLEEQKRKSLEHYQDMKAAGASAEEVARAIQQDGKNMIDVILTIRPLYGLSLTEAKKVYITSDGTDWGKYQKRIADALETAFQEWEAEEKNTSDTM